VWGVVVHIARHGSMASGECDEDKLAFLLAALGHEDPFLRQGCLDDDVDEALQWMAALPAEGVNATRETITVGIECWAERLRRDGACVAWLHGADPSVRKVSTSVNGPLFSELASHVGHVDPGCVEFFKEGEFLVCVGWTGACV